MRKLITKNPYEDFFNPQEGQPYEDGIYWPCSWITYNSSKTPPYVLAFRRKFHIDKDCTVTAHVSADERYELYLDGVLIGRGSERGDKKNWFYETYDIDLTQGEHIIVAKVWALAELKPWAQVSVYSGFIFSPEGDEHIKLLGTGVADWQVIKLTGYSFANPAEQCGYGGGSGHKVIVDGAEFLWGFESGQDNGSWEKPIIMDCGNSGFVRKPTRNVHIMRYAMLPPMFEREMRAGKVRYVSQILSDDVRFEPVLEERNILSQNSEIETIISCGNVTIEKNRKIRIIIDLENYYCVYPKLTVSGGKGSFVKVSWSESLFDTDDLKNHTDKGNRDEIEGKYYRGVGDIFYPDGENSRAFDTLWWECGRYIEIIVCTGDFPLTINKIEMMETRYPLEMESHFTSSDERLEQLIPISMRTLQMCAHETYMDCPYYEQLMYGGDTRSEILVTYTSSKDDKLPKKALSMFDAAREGYGGLTACAYPENSSKVIPSFSLWWIGMVYDFSKWRDDRDFVKKLMPGVRAVMETILSYRNNDGLIVCPGGWDYIDWSQNHLGNWHCGVAPDSNTGINSILNWQAAYVLKMLSEIEEYVGETELAKRAGRMSKELSLCIKKVFWDEEKGMFADDPLKINFSEHSQCMAILSGELDEDCCKRVFDGLINAAYLAKTSIFYSHYLFDVLGRMKRIDVLLERLEPWYELEKMGFVTLPEYIEGKSRSDCHAWSTHPIYHYFATILGIRPASNGFLTAKFTPQLANLQYACGTMVHPKGNIKVEYKKDDDKFIAKISLPNGITGVLNYGECEYTVNEGENLIEILI